MPTSCPKCELDPDGRCQECVALLNSFILATSRAQIAFGDRVQKAQREMEETIKVLTAEFRTKPHQCDECLRSNGDYAMARLIRQLSADPLLAEGVTAELYQGLKLKIVSWGITQTPLLDKAWSDAQKR